MPAARALGTASQSASCACATLASPFSSAAAPLGFAFSFSSLSFQIIGRCHAQRVFTPSAAQRLNQLDAGNKSLSDNLCLISFSQKCATVRIHHFQVTNNAGGVTLQGQIGRPSGARQGALLRF